MSHILGILIFFLVAETSVGQCEQDAYESHDQLDLFGWR